MPRQEGGNVLEVRPFHLTSQLCDLMPQASPERGQDGRRKERTHSVPPATVSYDWTLAQFPKEVTQSSRREVKVPSQESYMWKTNDTYLENNMS